METGQFEKALEQFRRTVELDPQQYNSRVRLGLAYAVVHRYAEAERELKKAEEISPNTAMSLATLAYVYALQGKKTQAERMLPKIKTDAVKADHPAIVSQVYLGLDRKEDAIEWLKRAYQRRDPYLDLLRSDPKFRDLERYAQNTVRLEDKKSRSP